MIAQSNTQQVRILIIYIYTEEYLNNIYTFVIYFCLLLIDFEQNTFSLLIMQYQTIFLKILNYL